MKSCAYWSICRNCNHLTTTCSPAEADDDEVDDDEVENSPLAFVALLDEGSSMPDEDDEDPAVGAIKADTDIANELTHFTFISIDHKHVSCD